VICLESLSRGLATEWERCEYEWERKTYELDHLTANHVLYQVDSLHRWALNLSEYVNLQDDIVCYQLAALDAIC